MTENVEYSHDVDAKHASNLGEESVANKVQAVKELVKNAYDGDAENVRVELVGHDTKDISVKEITKITVRDDGYAMTDEDFKTKFFRIGTKFKIDKPSSPIHGRRVVGEKGMGHYAAKRLGSGMGGGRIAEKAREFLRGISALNLHNGDNTNTPIISIARHELRVCCRG